MVWDPSNKVSHETWFISECFLGFVIFGGKPKKWIIFPLDMTCTNNQGLLPLSVLRALLRHCIVSCKKHTQQPDTRKKNHLMVTTNDIRPFACQSHARSLASGNKNRCSVTTPAWKQWWCSRSSWARFLALLDQIPNSWAKRCFGVQAVPTAQLKQQGKEGRTGTRTYDAFWPPGGRF